MRPGPAFGGGRPGSDEPAGPMVVRTKRPRVVVTARRWRVCSERMTSRRTGLEPVAALALAHDGLDLDADDRDDLERERPVLGDLRGLVGQHAAGRVARHASGAARS